MYLWKMRSMSFHFMLKYPTGQHLPPSVLSSAPAIASPAWRTVTMAVPPLHQNATGFIFRSISTRNTQTGLRPGCAPKIYGNSSTETERFSSAKDIASLSCSMRLRI